MNFSRCNDYVIREVGDLILAVDIVNNCVFEIDNTAKSYIEYAKANKGIIDEVYFATIENKSIEIIRDELNCLSEALNT